MRIFQNQHGINFSDRAVVSTAIASLGFAIVLTFADDLAPFEKHAAIPPAPDKVETLSETYVSAGQFASFIGVSDGTGNSIDMGFINREITNQNQLTNQALLVVYADEFVQKPSTLARKLSLSISQALLEERGYAFPWLDAPLPNTTPTELTAQDFARTLGAGANGEVTTILNKFDQMHTLHLTHYFDTTVLSKTEYHVAVAVLQERGAI